jgi:competence protein ComEC
MTQESLDLRLAPVAISAWCACALAVDLAPVRALILAAILLLACGLVALGPVRQLSRAVAVGVVATLGVAAAGLGVTALRAESVQTGPLPELARQRAQVVLVGTLVTDPVTRPGGFGDYVLAKLRAEAVQGRGSTTRIRAPVLVVGDIGFDRVRLGDRVRIAGRLSAAAGSDLAAVAATDRAPTRLAAAPWWHRGIAAVRTGVRVAHEPLPEGPRALVPALVDGDDAGMPAELAADFRTTGLTHLLAVSGSNLTLVLAFVMLIARWSGVRGRGHMVVGAAAVVFFVLLARPEPSVLRAAAMGLVGLVGLSAGGRRRGTRALGVAVVLLVLLDPWLARSPGFILSTLATVGILLLAGPWRDALARWLPRWLAEAIAVPLAAQMMCTPVVAALSGQVSVVAVASNLLAAPAVGPATVIGLLSGVAAVVSDRVGQVGGLLAGVPAWWIVEVAERSARLDGATMSWGSGFWSVSALALLCALAIAALPRVLRNAPRCIALVVVLGLVVARPVERAGWPPSGWLVAMCDVGQGDGLVLRSAPGTAVVVDAGPDPRAIDRCLDRLDVVRVPLVVLTHFHADHVDGLAGVFDGRLVGEVEVSPLAEPADRAAAVAVMAAEQSSRIVVGSAGERRVVGAVTLEILAPTRVRPSQPNNTSLVLSAEVAGRRILLTGDAEPEEQSDLLDLGDRVRTEILKVPHHGSANVDPDFLAATRPVVAIVSAGKDNTYGHPSRHLLGLLSDLGVPVFRTDQDGDIVIAERDGRLVGVTER